MKQYEVLEVGLFNGTDEVFYEGYKRCVATFVNGENASDIVFPKVKEGDGATVTHLVIINNDGTERKWVPVY